MSLPGAQPGGAFGAFAPPKFLKHSTEILTYAETFEKKDEIFYCDYF